MTTTDHIERTKKLAQQAAAWEDQTCEVCTCPTCGVVNARLRAALRGRGWSSAEVHHVRVEGFDFRGGCDPYLAVVKVEHDEVHRAYSDLTELLDNTVLDAIERSLRRHVCSQRSS